MADWTEIKTEYIRGGGSYRQLAKKYDVSFATLKKIAGREKWVDLRERAENKRDTKIVEKVANKQAKTADMFGIIADKLLKMISDGIDDGSITVSGRGYRDVTGALKDLREIKNIKNELDVQEQIARIEKLRRDAQSEDEKSGSIEVKIADDIEEYAE